MSHKEGSQWQASGLNSMSQDGDPFHSESHTTEIYRIPSGVSVWTLPYSQISSLGIWNLVDFTKIPLNNQVIYIQKDFCLPGK
jgi:hypothetical protein